MTMVYLGRRGIWKRVRKIGGTTLRSIGHVAKLQRVKDNDAEFVTPQAMLRELMADNEMLAANMREAHEVAERHNDVATPACSRISSIRPSAAPGSCSRHRRVANSKW